MSKIKLEGSAVGTGELSIEADNDAMIFSTGSTPTEAMRIDSSGNLLVGTTLSPNNLTATTTDEGMAIGGDGLVTIANSEQSPLVLNRLSNDGTILQFRKDGTKVGSIGSEGGNSLIVQGGTTSGAGLHYHGNSFTIAPARNNARIDNVIDLGVASYRFDDIYATNGTIQTSDRNEKQDIEELSEAEQRVAVACKGLMRKYRWKDAVAEKGDDARIHFGIIAQDLQDAFAAEGLDAGRYAMFISSTWWEATETYTDDDGVEQTRTNTYDTAEEAPEGATERTRLGVRYPELLAFIIAAI
jgi:hypothetical protein